MGGLASDQIKCGILVCQQATVHICGAKPNQHCRVVATLAIFANLFWDRMPALPGTICKCGRSFTKRICKFPVYAMLTRSPIILRRNINSGLSFSPSYAATSNYSTASMRLEGE